MFETITLLIDNEEVLLDEFIAMVDKYDEDEGLSDFADVIQTWFEQYAESLECKFSDNPSTKRSRSIEFVFTSILAAATQDISHQEWLEIARHYMTKAAEAGR